jgi:hypothetical protein
VSAEDHASAVESIREEGRPVTFTLTTPGLHDPATDTYGPPTVSSVSGWAIEVKSDEKDFRTLGFEPGEIMVRQPATLLFAPATYGALPALHASVTWAGAARKVLGMLPLRPDGVVIMARVVVA